MTKKYIVRIQQGSDEIKGTFYDIQKIPTLMNIIVESFPEAKVVVSKDEEDLKNGLEL